MPGGFSMVNDMDKTRIARSKRFHRPRRSHTRTTWNHLGDGEKRIAGIHIPKLKKNGRIFYKDKFTDIILDGANYLKVSFVTQG